MKIIKVNYDAPIPYKFTGIVEYLDRRKEWYIENKIYLPKKII
jgi:hypothetical protein